MPELKVKSGRRDQAANAAAGGARGSQHLAGNALDIDIAGKSDAEKAAILAAAVASGARGIGLYAGGRSLHVDTRQAPTVWGLDEADAYRGLKKPDGTPDIEATLAKAPAWARPTLQRLYGEPVGTLPLPAFGETPVAASPGALDYFGLVRQHESGGNDQAASRGPDGQTVAVGRYQFTAGTWAALAQKHPGLELSADGRGDPDQQERAMRALTADNQAALAKAGLPITGANTYMAHFLGATGAVKFLQALRENPEQSAAELFPAAAASNKGVFYDHNSGGARSLAEVYRRQTAMFGADAGQPIYSAGPGYADAPADPAFADIPPREQDRLLNQAAARRREGESLSRGALESGVRDATLDLTTIGRHDGPLPGIADFTKAYGPQAGAQRYADFQRIVSLGADIDAIKAMTPAEQSAWLARFTPQGDGPDPDGARDRYARARQAIALNLAFRSKDPNAYVRALNPRIDRLWQEAGNSPERLKAALSATNAAMDRLGMPVEERRLIPKAMVDQALAAFGDRSKPMAERLAPLRAAIVAGADPGAQQAIFGQMVSAGLPPALEYAAIAYAKGDAPLAERFATAALRSLDAGDKTTGDPADASFASPAAAANAPAGPAPMRSLSGPAIDLGPAAAQALGSSLTGDERASRAETVRTRMIEDAMRSNGGDRPAAIAQTDRDLASLQGDGWAPGMFMRAPMAGAGTQLAFQNTENNPAFPGATQSDGASRMPAPLPGGKSKIGKGLGAGLLGIIGGEISNSIWPQPEEGSENYPDTSIPKSYYVPVDPLGKVLVPPAITRLFLDGQKDFAPDLPAEFKERSLSIEIGNVNSAIQDARFQLMRAERQGDPQPYYTATSWDGLSYDIAFAPEKEADGTVTVTAIRPRGRLTNWVQQAIGQKDPMPGAWWGTPPKPLWEADAPQSDPIPIGTPGIPNASPAKEPAIHRPVWTKDNPYDEVTYDSELKRTGNSALALEVAKAAYRTRTDNPSSGGSFSASGGGQSPPPRRVTPETDWVKDFLEKLAGVKEDWATKALHYQKNNNRTLPQPDVFTIGQTDGPPIYSVNPGSRPDRGDKNKDSLAADSVRRENRPPSRDGTRPNETMYDAHAELYVLQQLYDQGRTQGRSLRMVVSGRDLCPSCREHLPAAAEKAGLKEWTIYEQTSGKTLYWKSGDPKFTASDGD
ncbi:cytidine deaminase-like fold-containing protein [Labrys okinawensis]|uniref:cytidine deaminase-like fold-containing protein n=1 Tax=Labrys okinawensis TaxID=346911 RepID=UPI0015E28DE8|nr:D-Ala-D-Ala carboxypeptidase family metallohydrolase [Labrys okinawensis]